MAEPPSSPPSEHASAEDALAWYKSQYEQLEHELSEFQQSSKELEAELEKDLDAADKREQALREKAEELSFQVEEWKRKYRESKAEANAAQNALEKEITTLRDANRTLQLRLRDIEVANDDFERQARNTTSSLEDLESKYNVAIERAVMMEEEIKLGEQEREQLRVEAQRLREELSDLKIEAEILQDKLRKQDARHHLAALSTDVSLLDSSPAAASPAAAAFDRSPNSTASSPLITTPPDSKSVSTVETLSELQDPPSPPMSDASVPLRKAAALPPAAAKTPASSLVWKSRLPSADSSVTPKPRLFANTSTPAPRVSGSRLSTAAAAGHGSTLRTPAPRSATTTARAARGAGTKAPSTSLSHIRSLTAQMQRLEARVQSARSKLPAPVATPPRASPRNSLGTSSGLPSTVTIRSRKRTTGGSTATSSVAGGGGGGGGDDVTPTNTRYGPDPGSATTDFRSSTSSVTGGGSSRSHVPRLSTSGVSRLSFGPLPNRNPMDPDGASRPSSRASVSSYAGIPRPASRTDSHHDPRSMPPPRPMSRASLGRSKTPISRPRSSLGGHAHGQGHGHGHSQSVSYATAEMDESITEDAMELRTPSRRGTYSRYEAEAAIGSGIPPPSAIPMPSSARRQSGGGAAAAASSVAGRRTSSSGLRDAGGTMKAASKLADVGERF